MRRRLLHVWNTHRRLIVGLAVVAILAAGRALPAHAAVQDTIFNDFLSPIVNAMIRLFSLLTAYIVGLLVLVAKQNNFINSEPVALGFPIVRDLANMVFIIALLIIAAGTILRLENYRYNRLLGRLIVMAFLVNLSRFITGFFIQTSQVFMLTFVNAFKDIALGNFAYMFGLDKVLNFTQQHAQADPAAVFMSLVGGLAMMIIAFSVTLALCIILIVRIIMLWALTILSPLAYALRIIPNTEKYASQWWSEFGKYLVTGPVLAFFLWLALALAAATGCSNNTTCTTSNNIILQSSTNNSAAVQNINASVEKELGPLREPFVTQVFDPSTFLTFLVSIVFLMIGMQIASRSGTAGAGLAKRIYEGGLGAGATLTGLNAIRDRTIAPIQGYLAQRRARSDAGVKERTLALGARVDQGLSKTVGQIGRGQAALGGAAGRALRGAGRVVTGKETVQEALQATAAAGREGIATGTRAFQQAQQRIEAFKTQKVSVRGQELDVTSPRVTVDDLRTLADGFDGGAAAAATQELVRRGKLESRNVKDIGFVQRAGQYLGDRQAGSKFVTSVEAVDAELARKSFFGDIADEQTRQRMIEAIQARTLSTRVLDRDDLKYLTESNRPAGQEFATGLVNTARNADELKKFVAGVNEDYRSGLFNLINMDGKKYEERKMVAEATGQISKAFQDQGQFTMTEENGKQIPEVVKFFKNRNKKLSDIVASNGADAELLKAMESRDEKTGDLKSEINEKEMLEMMNKSDFHRDSMKKAIEERYGDRASLGPLTSSRKSKEYQLQEQYRRVEFKGTGGEKNFYDHADSGMNEAFGALAKSLTAGELRRLHLSEKYQDGNSKKIIDQLIGLNMNLRNIGEYAGMGSAQYKNAQDFVAAVQALAPQGQAQGTTSSVETRWNKMRSSEFIQGLFAQRPPRSQPSPASSNTPRQSNQGRAQNQSGGTNPPTTPEPPSAPPTPPSGSMNDSTQEEEEEGETP